MSFLFPQKKPKTLGEVVYALNEWILRASDSNPVNKPVSGAPVGLMHQQDDGLFPGQKDHETPTEQQKQASEEAGRLLSQIRLATWGRQDSNNPAEPDQLTALAKEVYTTNVLVPLLQNIRVLDFEARRDVASFFAFILKRQPTVDYLLNKVPEVFTILMIGAGKAETHRTVCQILRECAHHQALVQYMMSLQNFWWFFQYVDHQEFEVATDNFTTFQDFLRNFPDLTTDFLLRNMDYFTQCMNGLISSRNYVARRQTLKLLFQLMKQTQNHKYLLAYCSSVESLKLIMLSLKDKSKNIHYEAFQIFKCFVVNPKKPKPIVDILVRNRSKIIEMLEKPHILANRRDDQAYQNEREYVKEKIMALPVKVQRLQLHAEMQSQAQAEVRAQSELNYSPEKGQHYRDQYPYGQPNQVQPTKPNQVQPTHPNQPIQPTQVQPIQPIQVQPIQHTQQPIQVQGAGSPSRAQIPPALMNPRPASPVLSHTQSFPEN